MGGRGASSGGGGRLNLSNMPNTVATTMLRDALGTKGRPESAEDAIQRTNPNYNKGSEWRNNCQRVVYAYELRRRGYDVEANPYVQGDGFANRYFGGYRKCFEGQTWTPEGELGSRRTTVQKNIEAKMSGWGDGARAIVAVRWQGGHSGHVFNIEQKGGQTVAYDAQSGRKINLSDYLAQAMPSYTSISRVDNLTAPTENLAKTIRRRGG